MAWRRGRGTVNIELANVQSKIEDWSDDLDGDDGVIRTIQNQAASQKELRKIIKLALWVGTIFIGFPAFAVAVIDLIRIAQGH